MMLCVLLEFNPDSQFYMHLRYNLKTHDFFLFSGELTGPD